MTKIIIHSPSLDAADQQHITKAMHGQLYSAGSYYWLETDINIAPETISHLRMQLECDINLLPDDFIPGEVGLLVSDMDSTLINIECVDEIADFLGIKTQVAAITESAMRGEIDFQTSLRKRVGLLKGLDSDVLDRVYNERLSLNPGAEQLVAGLKSKGIKMALVSGGFTFFTRRLQARLGLDYILANELEIIDGKLTGEVLGDIVDGSVKADFLESSCEQLGIASTQAIAMGDGANDLLMMNVAGLGIAWQAKPAVQDKADAVLNNSGLDAVLHLLQINPA